MNQMRPFSRQAVEKKSLCSSTTAAFHKRYFPLHIRVHVPCTAIVCFSESSEQLGRLVGRTERG